MQHLLIKPVAGDDFYVEWSDIVDGFVGYGTRADVLADDGYRARFGWHETEILLRDGSADHRILPRNQIRTYIEASLDDPEGAFTALALVPDDETEPAASPTLEVPLPHRTRPNGPSA